MGFLSRLLGGGPRDLLADLAEDYRAEAMQAAKKIAPTRPHPRAPDEPPANLLAGGVAAVMDRGRDALKGLVARGNDRSRGGKQRQRDLNA